MKGETGRLKILTSEASSGEGDRANASLGTVQLWQIFADGNTNRKEVASFKKFQVASFKFQVARV